MQRPWNLVPQAVYSFSTIDTLGLPNMNICTYVVPISMKPKRYYIGVYKNTKTLQNVENTDLFALQILSTKNKRYVNRFGKKSGLSTDKSGYIKKVCIEQGKLFVLPDCIGYITLKKLRISEDGDHMGMLCEVMSYQYLNPDDTILTTSDLYGA